MLAACSTAGSLIATRATSAGVPIGLHAVKLRTRGDHSMNARVVSFRCGS
jgi:hypothetical protein